VTTARETPLVAVTGTGAGRYYARCRVCFACTPNWVRNDPVRILALAQAAGWRVIPARGAVTFARHELICPACARREETTDGA
jgi:hypothetical protein